MEKIQAESLYEFKIPSNPVLSPDGEKIIYTVMYPVKETNGYQKDLYLYKDGNNSILQENTKWYCFCWFDSDNLIVKGDSDKSESEFFLFNVNNKIKTPAFTVPINPYSVMPLGNGKYGMLAQTDLMPERNAGWDEITELPWCQNGAGIVNGYRNTLYVYDSNKKELKVLTEPYFSTTDCRASNGQLVWYGVSYDTMAPTRPGIYYYDSKTDKTECLLEEGIMFFYGIELINDYAIVIGTDSTNDDPWQPQDIFKINIKTKEYCKIVNWQKSAAICVAVSDFDLGGGQQFAVDGDKLYFTLTTRLGTTLCCVNLSGDISYPVKTFLPVIDCFDIKNGRLCYRAFDSKITGDLYLDGQKITDFNAETRNKYQISHPEYFIFIDKIGTEIDCWAIRPIGFEPGKKYPAILNIHGGPRVIYNERFYHEMQLEAANGYFVIYCNPHGSDGQSREFGDLYGAYGSIDFDDLMEFTDEAIKRFPEINPNCIGVSGGSYGGFMTNWIIGHTDRFRAACSQRSMANLVLYEHTSDIGYFWIKSEMLTTTREDTEQLWKLSPLRYACNAKTPTLFIHSDEDHRCQPVDAVSMFTALKMNGTPTKLVLFHGENHGLARSGRPENRVKRLNEILQWFDRYLK